nr:unnamed protein product [Spirometra erinaceieuropaei]
MKNDLRLRIWTTRHILFSSDRDSIPNVQEPPTCLDQSVDRGLALISYSTPLGVFPRISPILISLSPPV